MPKRDGGSWAAAVLASSIVIAFGIIAIAFMVAVLGRGTDPLVILGIGGVGLLIFQWLMFRSQDRDENVVERWYWARLLRKKRAKPEVEYQVKVIKPRTVVQESNGPPTAERIRELKENSQTWVPAGTSKRKRPPG